MSQAFVSVFRSPARASVALVIALVTLVVAILFPNRKLVQIVLSDPSIGFERSVQIVASLAGSLVTNFTPLAAAYTVLAAILIGINVVLAFHLVARTQRIGKGTTASGLLGLISGVFGIGCAACGSAILTAAAGTTFGAGFLALLPLDGQEAGILGVALLGSATYALLRQIGEPLTCAVSTHSQPSTT
jgi:hypothetical protein